MNIQEYSTFRNIREFPLGLLDDLFGDPDAVPELPPDFKGSLAYVMSTLDYRTTECILMRYQNHMTFADVIIMCMSVAGRFGIDIDEAVRQKMEINKRRATWKLEMEGETK